MPIDYVSDYEELTGKSRVVETKVVSAPEVVVEVAPATVAETA
jgi:hypothetical protein